MHSRLGAVRAAAVLAVFVAAGAAGCSSGGTGKSSSSSGTKMTAAQELAATLKTTQQAKSYGASMSMQISGIPGAGSPGGYSMTGTIRTQRQPTLLSEFDFNSFQMMGNNLGSMTEIVTPQAIYMKMPMLSAELHKQWMKLPFSDLKANGAALSQLLSQAQSGDPLSDAQLLAGAKNTRTVGTGTVNGVPVTELAGSEPATAGLSRLPASMRQSMGQNIEKLGIGQIQFQIWVDGNHDIRKEIVKEIGSTINMTLSSTLTSINQPVNISLPSGTQVATLPSSLLHGSGL